jgi:hypothetical protein
VDGGRGGHRREASIVGVNPSPHEQEALANAVHWGRQLPADAVLSHEAAALLHGFPLYRVPTRLTVTRSRGRAAGTCDLKVLRAQLRPRDVTAVAGVPVTSPARTVVDLGRSLPFREALVVADGALRAGARRQDLHDVLRHQCNWPRVPKAMRVVRHGDGRAESALESVTRSRFVELSLPMPELQVDIFGRFGWVARVDFWWEFARTVGEADGRVKYVADELWAEKVRQDDIEDAGNQVIRWRWATAHAPDEEFAGRLRRAFSRGVLLRQQQPPSLTAHPHEPDHLHRTSRSSERPNRPKRSGS